MRRKTESNLESMLPPVEGDAEKFKTFADQFQENHPEADQELERLREEGSLAVILEPATELPDDETAPCKVCGSDTSGEIFARFQFQDREHSVFPVLCNDCLERIHTSDVEPVKLTEETIQEYE